MGRTATAGGMAVARAEVDANRRRARGLALAAGIVPGIVVGVVVGVLTGVVGAVVALVVVAAVAAWAIWRGSTQAALRVVGAHVVADGEQPRLANVVEGLCATFGVRLPRLAVLEDPVANACALGRWPGDAVLVVTSGLLERLGLIELEGVVAHELAHVKRHDTAVSGVAVTVLAPVLAVSGALGRRGGDELLHRALGRGREYRADQVAAAVVRYPPGVHDALAQLTAGSPPPPGSRFEGRRLAATRWLWVDPAVGGTPTGPSGGRAGHRAGGLDDTEVRIAALGEW